MGLATHATNAHQRRRATAVGAIHLFDSKPQNRFEQANLRFANRKLRRVHADGKAARSRRHVVSRERPLATFVQAPLRRKGERMCRNCDSLPYRLQDACIDRWRHRFINSERNQKRPARSSKCVGLAKEVPPRATQSAIQSSIWPIATGGFPKSAKALLESLSNASLDSSPWKIGFLPSLTANSSANFRTMRISGPVMFKMFGGVEACASDSRLIAEASLCQTVFR